MTISVVKVWYILVYPSRLECSEESCSDKPKVRMIEDKILVRKIHTTDTRKRNKDTLDNKVFDTDVSLLFSLPEEAEARAGSA